MAWKPPAGAIPLDDGATGGWTPPAGAIPMDAPAWKPPAGAIPLDAPQASGDIQAAPSKSLGTASGSVAATLQPTPSHIGYPAYDEAKPGPLVPQIQPGAAPKAADPTIGQRLRAFREGLTDPAGNLARGTGEAFTSGLANAKQGFSAATPGSGLQGALGLGQGLLGALGMVTAPIGGAIEEGVVKPVTDLTGNPDLGDRAGLVAGLVPGGRAAGKIGEALAAKRVEPVMGAPVPLKPDRDPFGNVRPGERVEPTMNPPAPVRAGETLEPRPGALPKPVRAYEEPAAQPRAAGPVRDSEAGWTPPKGAIPIESNESDAAFEQAMKGGLKKEAEQKQPVPKTDFSNWKQVGPQLGSNPGGVFENEQGEKYYVKTPKTADIAANEGLTNALYKELKVPASDLQVGTKDGSPAIATRWVDLASFDPKSKTQVAEVQKHFASHAFLANWDAVGDDYDNQMFDGATPITVDSGGGLKYRAQGQAKPSFGSDVTEWETMRDPSYGPGGKVFSTMTREQIVESAKPVLALRDEAIRAAVQKVGYPESFAKMLIARRDDIAEKVINVQKNFIAPKNIAGATPETLEEALQKITEMLKAPVKEKPVEATEEKFPTAAEILGAKPLVKTKPLGKGFKTPPKTPPSELPKPFKPEAPSAGVVPEGVSHLKVAAFTAKKILDFQKELEAVHAVPTKLPKDHAARMKRAAELGFDTTKEFFHGTGELFHSFDTSKVNPNEPAIFLTDQPNIATTYGGKGIIPLLARIENPLEVDWKGQGYIPSKMSGLLKQAKAGGHDVLINYNMVDKGGYQTQWAFLKPENLRAKYANFDPAMKKSANFLSAAEAKTSDILQGTINDNAKLLAKEPGFVDGLKSVARSVQAILSPETMSDAAHSAVANVRSKLGAATRDSERSAEALRKYQKLETTMSLQDRLDFMDYLQTYTARGEPSAEFKPMLEAVRNEFLKRRAKLEASPSTENMTFQQDYFPQLWKDPDKAKRLFNQGGFGAKEGSSGFTKAKSIPSIADGIRLGLEPVSDSPLEMTALYIQNVDRFIATNEVFDEAVANNEVVWRNSKNAPDGFVEVAGRKNYSASGQKPYAPADWARIYNNYVSRRYEGDVGNILDTMQKASNAVTAMKLGLSGFHATLTVNEAITSGMANAITEASRGRVGAAALKAGAAYAKPITGALRGAAMRRAYLGGLSSAAPMMQRVIDAAVKANFRVAGKGRIADEYRFSNAGSFVEAWKKGALRAELAADLKDALNRPVRGTIKGIFKNIGRALETVSDPLFRTYIPLVKNGAFYDMVSSWLEANPTATAVEQARYARYAADVIDDRFGEMNQDNIFWTRQLKQIGTLFATSYSYEMGTARALGGAAVDATKLLGGGGWTDKLSYLIALPITLGTLGAIYEYMHTQTAPGSLQDLMAPRTGGYDPGARASERAELPTTLKDLYNSYENPRGEVTNKLNPFFSTMLDMFNGKDWRGDEIAKHKDGFLPALKAYAGFAADAFVPISFERTAKKGTAITMPERMLGIKNAPLPLTNPSLAEKYRRDAARREDLLKERHDRRAKDLYQ